MVNSIFLMCWNRPTSGLITPVPQITNRVAHDNATFPVTSEHHNSNARPMSLIAKQEQWEPNVPSDGDMSEKQGASAQREAAMPSEHIPASVIWSYVKVESNALSAAQGQHLKGCDNCVTVLGVCLSSTSIQHFYRLLVEQGLEIH